MKYLNTIRFPLFTDYDPPDYTHNVLSGIGSGSIYIAENSVSTPIKIISSSLWLWAQDTSTGTGATLTDFRVDLAADGGAASTIFTTTTDLTNTGENWSLLFGPFNSTSVLKSNIGTSNQMRLTASLDTEVSTGTGTSLRSVYPYVDITYEYSSSASRRTQWIQWPIFSGSNGQHIIPNNISNIFGYIPNVSGSGGLLSGYGSAIIRSAWLEIGSNNQADNNQTDITLGAKLAGVGNYVFNTRERAHGSDTYDMYMIKLPTNVLTSSVSLQFSQSVSQDYRDPHVKLNVIVDYNPTTSNRILNSYVSAVTWPGLLTTPGYSNTDTVEANNTFNLEEPNIDVIQAGGHIFWSINADTSMLIGSSSASINSYPMFGNAVAGTYGAAIKLNSASFSDGENVARFYAQTSPCTNFSGQLYVNYYSDIALSGVDAHNRYISWPISQFTFSALGTNLSTPKYMIPRAIYYVNGPSLFFNCAAAWSATQNPFYIVISGSNTRLATPLFIGSTYGDNELAYQPVFINSQRVIKLFPDMIDTYAGNTLLSIFNQKFYFGANFQPARNGIMFSTMLHSITGSLTGNISGSGPGYVTASLCRSDNGYRLQTKYISGSTYNFTTYWRNTPLYVDFYQNSTYKGRTKSDMSGPGFDVSLSCTTGSTSSEHSFTFIG